MREMTGSGDKLPHFKTCKLTFCLRQWPTAIAVEAIQYETDLQTSYSDNTTNHSQELCIKFCLAFFFQG